MKKNKRRIRNRLRCASSIRHGIETLAAVGLVAGMAAGTTNAVSADDAATGAMMRYPDVSRNEIIFLYANNLWTVSRNGGLASPLASPRGVEGFPKFSADGKIVAFVGNYDGNSDIYTIPTSGGLASRVTHHPAFERLCDWTPDGRLLFASNGTSSLNRTRQMLLVGAEGGMPKVLPIPYGSAGAISADGEWLAYTPNSRDFRTWKRYMGGLADDIWLFNLKTKESKRATDWQGTDTAPMWNGTDLYYLSDQGPNARLNIWKYDTTTGEREQITKFAGFDVKFPSMGPGPRGRGEIVFQHGADLYLLDLSNRQETAVKVIIPGGRPTLRPQIFDAAELVQASYISPSGKRAVVQARGDIWTLPAENGLPRNLTRTDGVAERSPAWSPDGRWIAYWSEASGEYQLYITQSDGQGETTQLTTDRKVFPWDIWWSPDSKKIVFTDKTGVINLIDVESKEITQVDVEPTAFRATGRSISWSHDNRFITYAKCADDTNTSSIWIYSVEDNSMRQVTSGTFPDRNPVFDRKGDYLYFASSRTFSPTYSDLDTTFIYKDSGNLLAVPLKADEDYVWAPKSDEEAWKKGEDKDSGEESEAKRGEDGDNENTANGGESSAAAAPDDGVSGTWSGSAQVPDMGELPLTITLTLNADNSVSGHLEAGPFSGDLSGTWDPGSKRLTLTLTIPDGTVVSFDLKIEDGKMTGTANSPQGAATISCERSTGESEEEGDDGKEKAAKKVVIDYEGFEERAILLPVGNGGFGSLAVNDKNQLVFSQSGKGIRLFDMKDDKKQAKDVQAGAGGFSISANGKKLLYGFGSDLTIRNAAPGGSGKRVKTSPMIVTINPRIEWHQIFHDVYLIYRDFFYDANMHGVDWKGLYEHYDPLIDDCTTREEVNYVIGELIAELNVGHAYLWGSAPGGDSAPSRNVGLLGCDFELDSDNNVYRIAKIYEGGAGDADARGPLSKPGVKVHEGDYLLKVNGLPMDTSVDPWTPFIGLSGQTVALTVSDKPTFDAEDADQREVLVKALESESGLRYRAWIEKNRKYVEEKTDGRVGYIHVPDTGVNGQNNLVRQMVGQLYKPALIVDERWNGGGQIPTRFIEMLNRPATNYWAVRDGRDWKWPPDSHQGPKCMLINGPSGSGGDAFPHYFRQTGLGKLIGTRTWGGLVGISGNPGLIDGGYTSVPTFGFYEMNGTWGIEGYGVAPDIEVIDDPAKMQDGRDPQLDAAIAEMLKELEANPYIPPKRPASADRTKMGRNGIPKEER